MNIGEYVKDTVNIVGGMWPWDDWKPRIKKIGGGLWQCTSRLAVGLGDTKLDAWRQWKMAQSKKIMKL